MRVSALEGHRLWASTYDAGLNPVVALESRLLSDLLCPINGQSFVDVACGTGRWMTHLRERGASVFGADASPEMLAQACQKKTLRGRLVLADAGNLPLLDRIADVTLCSFAAAYFTSLKAVMGEMARITRRGGRVVLSDLHPAGIAAGWTRSFRLHGSVYEMEHFNPSLDEFRAAGRDANLHLHIQIDASFGDAERLIFRSAGKAHMLAELSRVPAVWIGIWNKV
jgi:ubiquinone/menaquinone biosynthesis C-methylase UbiE